MENQVMKKKPGLSGYALKWIAIVTMAVDHTGSVLFRSMETPWLRYIGRLAFPIFCFLIVQGFLHTRDVKKYILRLAAFAVVSEIPYDLAFREELLEFGHQNVFFTLCIGLMVLVLLRSSCNSWIKTAGTLAGMLLAYFMKTDYGMNGVILICCFYIFITSIASQVGALLIVNLNMLLMGSANFQLLSMFSMIPISLYNGEKGRSLKYFFYIFYPAHLLVLYFIKLAVRG